MEEEYKKKKNYIEIMIVSVNLTKKKLFHFFLRELKNCFFLYRIIDR